MTTFIDGDVLLVLRALPARSQSLIIIIPDREVYLDDLAEAVYRVLVVGGEAIIAKTWIDAFELL